MINVVHIVEDLNIGGIERVVENISTSLDPRHFKTYVLCLSRGGSIADKLMDNHKNVEVLYITNYHNPLSVVKVSKWLKKEKIDIVHCHAYPAGVLGRIAAILAGVPCRFHHIHSTYLDLNKRNHLIERFLSIFTHKVICCSEAVKRFVVEKEGISEKKLIVLYNGTPEPKLLNALAINDLKNDLSIPQDVSVIGCVASLAEHKGHKYLLEAFKKIDKAYLLLIGDGPLRKKLEGEVFELGFSKKVIFLGYKMDVMPYMQLTDLIVLPSSEREGLPVTIVEAMSLSKPVIATNIGGIPEAVDSGRTGVIVKPQNSDALANAINRLLKSPALMHNMGLKGRDKYLKMFTLDLMIQGLEELYSRCK